MSAPATPLALSVLLLNLATVIVALVVYDQVVVRRDVATNAAGTVGVDRSDVVRRLEALEAGREPALRGAGTDPMIFERLDALEAALRTREGRAAPPPAAPRDETPTSYDLRPVDEGGAAPDLDEVQRWRRMRDAAQRQDKIERNRQRLDRAMDTLPLNLSSRQREKIHEAYVDFEPRMQEIWVEAKTAARATGAAGGRVDRATVVAETTSLIQQAFAEHISDIVHHADAEAIAEAVLAKGR